MFGLKKFSFCPLCGSPRFAESSEKSRRCEACGFEFFENPAAANVALILNEKGELLVERRGREPARGTLDLPGGFCDSGETAEEAVKREVLEETNLHVNRAEYLFSLPNLYRYSGLDIPTLDLFFRCEVSDTAPLQAADDAAACFWMPLSDIRPEEFGLLSIRKGVERYLQMHHNL